MAEKLTLVDTGVIFRNPLPGHRVINCIYPHVTVLDNGELFCLVRIGVALYSPDGMIEAFRSSDNGKTWTRQGPIHARDKYSYFDATVTKLRDGSLVAGISRVDLSDESKLMFNQVTGGLLPMPLCILRSTDNGKTWTPPKQIDLGDSFQPPHNAVTYGSVFELPDGTWFHTFETWKHYEDAGPYDLNMYGLFSRDQGKTWGERINVANGAAENRSYSHGQATRLADGRLYITAWTAEPQLQTYSDLHAIVSKDATCRTWEKPQPTGLPGQSSCAAQLDGKHMVVTYSHRDDPKQPGIKVALSCDAGKTYDKANALCVWDAYGKEALGVPQTDKYPTSHDAIAYGAPRITALGNGEAMAVWWCTQGSDTHTRWAHVRME